MQRSDYVWMGSLAFLAGAFGAKYYYEPNAAIFLVCLTPILFSRRLRIIGVVLLCVTLGVFRTSQWQSSSSYMQGLVGEQVSLRGVVSSDQTYDDRRQAQFMVNDLVHDGRSIRGQVRVQAVGVSVILRGDHVQVDGRLRDGFASWQGSISFARVELLERSEGSFERLRRQFAAGINSFLSDEHAALALGIIVGQRTTISDETDTELRRVGLTHIIAVSGYNLTVLVRLVRRRMRGLPRKGTFALSLGLCLAFVAIAGNAASIIRAAWVVFLSLLAWYHGKRIRPMVLLMLSAAITVWFDVYYIWYDLGWWLSFLAFYGVLIVGPAINMRLFQTNKPGFLPEAAVESFAASIMTMPLIAWIFGRVSVISLLANVLVVPTIPFIMVAIFSVGLFALIGFSFLAGLAGYVTGLMLGSLLGLAGYLSTLQVAESPLEIGLISMLAIYLVILIWSWVLNHRVGQMKHYDLLE
ncbi:MAG: ComEC/Rec2 family competence protein [Patescibacteria group bacterium]